MDVYLLSHHLFANHVKKVDKYFTDLGPELVRAHLSVSRDKWLAVVFLVGSLSFIFTVVFGIIISIFAKGMVADSILLPIAAGLLISATSAFLAIKYPSVIASERKKKIENVIAFATIYMSTISRSGFPPQQIFKMLSKFKEYGEVSIEASLIARDVEVFGLDLTDALGKAIGRSPSADWTELLAGLKTTITIGGDLSAFLDEKAKGFVADYKRRLQDFSNLLSILVEVYITLVIVGAVFFIVTTSIVVAIGGVSTATIKLLNYAMVLIGIPVLTAAFILIIKGVSPLEE